MDLQAVMADYRLACPVCGAKKKIKPADLYLKRGKWIVNARCPRCGASMILVHK